MLGINNKNPCNWFAATNFNGLFLSFPFSCFDEWMDVGGFKSFLTFEEPRNWVNGISFSLFFGEERVRKQYCKRWDGMQNKRVKSTTRHDTTALIENYVKFECECGKQSVKSTKKQIIGKIFTKNMTKWWCFSFFPIRRTHEMKCDSVVDVNTHPFSISNTSNMRIRFPSMFQHTHTEPQS